MSPEKETYLGDGLYASFDGYQIKLRTPREDGNHVIFMEPQIIEAFDRYVAGLKKAAEESIAQRLRDAQEKEDAVRS